VWFCVTLAALIIGLQFGKREVRVVEKPVQIVTTKEVFVERPVERAKEELVKTAENSAAESSEPIIHKRNSPAEKAKLHERYDPFLVQFGLTETQMDRFVDLKLAIYEAQDDLQAAVAQGGLPGGTAEVEAMRTKLTKPMWDEIRQLLGENGMAAYGDYEQLSAIRPTIRGLFEHSSSPVSNEQIDQIARLVIANTQIYREKPTDISSRRRTDWHAVARDAESMLTPAQVDVIRARAARQLPR
jgi:hypothetical protein